MTCSIVFGVGYGLGLGWFFGVVSGATNGVTIAIELNRAACKWAGWPLMLSSWEADKVQCDANTGALLWRSLGLGFAAAFAVLLALGQIVAYSRGIRPAMDYAATGRPRITRRVWAILVRTVGYMATALAVWCSTLITRGHLRFAQAW